MTDDESQAEMNFSFIREGLECIAADKDRQIELNEPYLLDNLVNPFDPIPEYYVTWLVETGRMDADLGQRIRELYREIHREIDPEFNENIEAFIIEDSEMLKRWRATAKQLLSEVNDA